MNFRDRIKELRGVKASELRPHPKNWRTHPEEQENALRGILADIGFVDALIVRELPDGTLQIVDGHLRAETTPDSQVPALGAKKSSGILAGKGLNVPTCVCKLTFSIGSTRLPRRTDSRFEDLQHLRGLR